MNFRHQVYKITKKIPQGKVATYGQIARLVGRPKAARAIGYFMKTNSFAPDIPCHRVVASDGSLTGYSGRGGLNTKKRMLKQEGVVFKKYKIDLKKSLWKDGQS